MRYEPYIDFSCSIQNDINELLGFLITATRSINT